jgi:hypothetical protein
MNWADFIIIGIITVSAVIGIARGLIREVLSLAVWIGAVVVAWFFHKDLAFQFEPHISTPGVRLAVAFVIIVLGVLFLGAIDSHREDRSDGHRPVSWCRLWRGAGRGPDCDAGVPGRIDTDSR